MYFARRLGNSAKSILNHEIQGSGSKIAAVQKDSEVTFTSCDVIISCCSPQRFFSASHALHTVRFVVTASILLERQSSGVMEKEWKSAGPYSLKTNPARYE